ncbi:MAG: acetate--CoA ligase family protein [Desulfitobacteriaceae bacterium]|nr:acetate--CoA ligase family protein [Desulfitobacteriaceae bacterium]
MQPQSIALVGASADPKKISGRPLNFLLQHHYQGRIYPINPRYDKIEGIQTYPSLDAVPEAVDLVLNLLPAENTLSVIEQCLTKQARSMILFGSGFAETGEEGKRLQEAVRERIANTSLRVLGPNCQGMINLEEGIAASFTQALFNNPLKTGPIAFLSQSGAVGGSMLDIAQGRGVGFSYWLSTGNQLDLDVIEVGDYLLDDPRIKVIAAYMEGIQEPQKYLQFIRRAEQVGKPLVIFKVGRSAVGKRAAASHTGSMASSDKVFEVVSKQHGVFLANDVDEVLDLAMTLAVSKAAHGSRIGIVTSSGGAGVILSDHAEEQALEVPVLAESTQEFLKQYIPSFGAVANPVDVTAQLFSLDRSGESKYWREVCLAVGKDPAVDILVVALTMSVELSASLARGVAYVAQELAKPVVVTWLAGDLCEPGYQVLKENNIPFFPSAGRCAKAARALVSWGTRKTGAPVLNSVIAEVAAAQELLNSGQQELTESSLRQLLQNVGIPVPQSRLVHSQEEAVAAAEELGYPVVLKIQSPQIMHKTEVGGVRLGLENAGQVRVGFSEIMAKIMSDVPGAVIEGILVQEQLPPGIEMVLGITRDKDFGLVFMLGLGGVTVELFGDIVMRHLPVSADDIRTMLKDLRSLPLLLGFRGRPPADIDALIKTVVMTTEFAYSLGEACQDLEINPLIVYPEGHGVKAADALMRMNVKSIRPE